MSSRRQFIKDAALIGAGMALSSSFYSCRSKKDIEVIIIGAGFAGLAAAYKLTQMGIKCTILEARKRIGGRVFSFTTDTPEKFVVELGAEWIGKSHDRLLEFCDEFKLTKINNQMRTHLEYKGQYADPVRFDQMKNKDWEDKWKKLVTAYQQIPEDQRDATFDYYDWWRYLKNNDCPEFDLDIRELMDSTDFGESIRNVSAAAALSEYAAPGLKSDHNEMDWKIKGGNDVLAQMLADKIGVGNIIKGDAVVEVDQVKRNKVKVTCSSGKVRYADKIICTVPTFSLKKINWKPELPDRIVRGVNELQYARINKHPVQFSKKFWGADDFDMITDGPVHYLYHATIEQHREKGILTAYSIGDKADLFGWSEKNDAWNKVLMNKALSNGFGDISHLIEKQWNYYWGKDDYSFGAYAIFKPGQWKRVQKELSEPFIHTHFAGEHLADWQGFMEGAINSGEEAAQLIAKG